MQATKIEHYFDDIISSHDFGFAKQEQHFWHELTRNIGLKKERAIFFDDSQDVLHAARKFNIGQIIAISKPSSKLDAKEVSGFINIENFLKLCLLILTNFLFSVQKIIKLCFSKIGSIFMTN